MGKATATEVWTIGGNGRGFAGPVVGSMRYASASVEWQPTDAKGFWVKPLFEDTRRGEKTLLMKVDPGAYSPMHTHPGELEQIYVLEGSFYDQDATMGPGDYCCRASDAAHEAGSKTGAIVLRVYTRQ
jgi:anti-sigma factor ChrR (cupin superfamily)